MNSEEFKQKIDYFEKVALTILEEAVKSHQIKLLEDAAKALLEKANDLKKKNKKYRYIDDPFEPSIGD